MAAVCCPFQGIQTLWERMQVLRTVNVFDGSFRAAYSQPSDQASIIEAKIRQAELQLYTLETEKNRILLFKKRAEERARGRSSAAIRSGTELRTAEASFSRTLLLGEHQNQPFYALSIHSGFTSSPPIVLHSGPANTSPPLASVDYHSFSTKMSMTLPPAPKGSPGGAPVIELEYNLDFPTLNYAFAMGVGPNCERLERFEWRSSSGEAIAMLDGRSRGWKLVRLAQSAGSAGFRSSDGKEVVAVWTDAGLSMTKVAKFAFTGSGLTGELGERWAIMAVISGLAICERQRQRRRNNG
ncbi:hypothetical protein CH063_07655 [Colletotrichum higginsianum]|uniref:Uncharacterized protein n=1 Tax=Colletotrichum higginsianum (strain IMI 349063) TaxID=759273 RepID=H1V6Y1_COLHI|nr:hypothetical protein CH063_07655 [Colletotrichum higginsianum]